MKSEEPHPPTHTHTEERKKIQKRKEIYNKTQPPAPENPEKTTKQTNKTNQNKQNKQTYPTTTILGLGKNEDSITIYGLYFVIIIILINDELNIFLMNDGICVGNTFI